MRNTPPQSVAPHSSGSVNQKTTWMSESDETVYQQLPNGKWALRANANSNENIRTFRVTERTDAFVELESLNEETPQKILLVQGAFFFEDPETGEMVKGDEGHWKTGQAIRPQKRTLFKSDEGHTLQLQADGTWLGTETDQSKTVFRELSRSQDSIRLRNREQNTTIELFQGAVAIDDEEIGEFLIGHGKWVEK
ncbi:hypothetical protein [Novipirellula maiorica]|nr:hypothetical protein [Rhodopirellula maiorica]